MAKKHRPPPEAPTRERVLAALEKAGHAVHPRDLARMLNVAPDDKAELRRILRELEHDGVLGKSGRRKVASASALPATGVMEIIDRDGDGELLGRMRGETGLYGPTIRLAPGEARGRQGEPAIGVGDRVLARIEKEEDDGAVARVIKRLGQSAHRILGVFHADKRGGGRIEPADRKARHDLIVLSEHQNGARDGDLVFAELASGARAHGPKRGIIKEIVGQQDDPRAASILAIHTHGVPMGFSEDEERQARFAKEPTLGKRTDLRQLPLVTIDPHDARDHDDAVFAQADDDPKNKGGWRVWVAIADVSAYVTPGSPLDHGALKRGNSTYFPDRVAPMLPEKLSADLCSLMDNVDRACLAVEMVFNAQGRKIAHRFTRGLMRSAATLSYEQAQGAIDGAPDEATGPLLDTVLKPLWSAYACVKQGREARAPLEIDAPEHKIIFDAKGRVAGVKRRERFDAHKLIEEFMIQANVCAAETLEQRRTPLLYRVHDQPSEMKVAALQDFLPTVGLSWAKGQVVTAARFNRILAHAAETEHAEIVNEVILRTQAQAIYSPENIGHFGLNLTHYAHFTSPIRRYADLIVHRALIKALKLGPDGQTEEEAARLDEIGEHITMCERRSMAAERDATSRYIASFLADRVGAVFDGKISGVTRFGLFIRLEDSQADGLAPISTLGPERWIHDEKTHALVGEQSGARYQLGMSVAARLEEATPVSGGLLFRVLTDPLPPAPGWRRTRPSRQTVRDVRSFRKKRR
ncbi:MAG: ribonuclease R [Alphaproteobacteria bacterium]|nr:ribonuclease R [Alphaproteobacteria bacterium]